MENFKDYKLKQIHSSSIFTFVKPNNKGEKMEVEIVHCEGSGKKSLPYLWYKNGFTDRVINKYLTCHCYAEKDGRVYRKYNPFADKTEINFVWLLEDTEENVQKLIDEVARRFYGISE